MSTLIQSSMIKPLAIFILLGPTPQAFCTFNVLVKHFMHTFMAYILDGTSSLGLRSEDADVHPCTQYLGDQFKRRHLAMTKKALYFSKVCRFEPMSFLSIAFLSSKGRGFLYCPCLRFSSRPAKQSKKPNGQEAQASKVR